MTLDAGGTNFVFSAIKGQKEIVQPIGMPSNADNLEKCLSNLVEGFMQVRSKLKDKPVAISFAFPGPADYPNGIIGDLGNLPAFRGGVALGPMLEDIFEVPVFINNDGDLYAYGEAIAGVLPWVNEKLVQAGSPKRYHNLVGLTLGTGFGGGLVRNNELFLGDNSGATEVWLLSNKNNPNMNIEEGISIRAVRRAYAELTGVPFEEAPSPKEIYDIGVGTMSGDQEAALEAFRRMGELLGNALCNVLTIADGIAVIGGGVAGARALFMPAMLKEMRSCYTNPKGDTYPRLSQRVFNLEDPADIEKFVKGNAKEIIVPGTYKKISYDPMSRIGVAISRIGTSQAISIGAYAYALKTLDKVEKNRLK